MTFWDQHKNALSIAALGIFVLLVGYFAFIRGADGEAEEHRQAIDGNMPKLAKYYPELENPNNVYRPTIGKVRQECDARYKEYTEQLKELKARLRFPFEEFKYTKVPDGEIPGVYLIHRSSIVAANVETLSLQAGVRGLPAQLDQDWLGFTPSETPDKVTRDKAEEELRKLCLAEKVTLLAIEAGISRVIKVKPLGKSEEAGTHLERNPKYRPGGKEPEKVAVEYPDRFIVNYPVSIQMIGSIDSVMRFIHSVRQEKRFLVIRSFRIVSREDRDMSGETADRMRPGEVYVTISAACMDFKEMQARPVAVPVQKTEPPKGPVGA